MLRVREMLAALAFFQISCTAGSPDGDGAGGLRAGVAFSAFGAAGDSPAADFSMFEQLWPSWEKQA